MDMDSFVYTASPARVIFGSGTVAKLPEELARLGLSRPLLLSTPYQTAQADELERILLADDAGRGIAPAGLFAEATMHTPVAVTERAVEAARAAGADCLVSVGGGSTIGLGKAVSVRTGLYHVAVPTTYAGSEVTPILGETADGRKVTRSAPEIRPGTVIYDVDLTLTLPAGLTATSGVNAVAHAVEALYAQNGNPVVGLLAQEGVRALSSSLPGLAADPASRPLRAAALYGAWLCGTCLGSVGMSLHHKLCHTLGGSFGLPHAETHTIVLPHALAYNLPRIPAAAQKLAEALPGSEGDAIRGLNLLLDRLGVERSLAAFGMKEADIDRAAELAAGNPYWNPREVEQKLIREVIRRAWAGEPARADL
ncbi:uncharacterized protein E0L32_011799 [Thyridium curvatum]|uniref:Uncharacterized protein n=1 Tax=Thyridium curvatum TaxID=1093900 RepID=A0A507BM83_9PEZI|nr:uncharacterized protein E0L32_011799 [Thyridium curvatum]TPX18301.1 hypothetical protein E0L32_011799 [Thyridium curvatum]